MGRRHAVRLQGLRLKGEPLLINSLIAHPKDRVATLPDVQTLPFFQKTKFSALRETTAPFVPMLDGETDVGYFDSFESAEDMAKYAEVFKKQRDVEAVQEKGLGNRNNWVSSRELSLDGKIRWLADILGWFHIRQERCGSWCHYEGSYRQASR
jgi:hypothetical protein